MYRIVAPALAGIGCPAAEKHPRERRSGLTAQRDRLTPLGERRRPGQFVQRRTSEARGDPGQHNRARLAGRSDYAAPRCAVNTPRGNGRGLGAQHRVGPARRWPGHELRFVIDHPPSGPWRQEGLRKLSAHHRDRRERNPAPDARHAGDIGQHGQRQTPALLAAFAGDASQTSTFLLRTRLRPKRTTERRRRTARCDRQHRAQSTFATTSSGLSPLVQRERNGDFGYRPRAARRQSVGFDPRCGAPTQRHATLTVRTRRGTRPLDTQPRK